VIKMNEEAKYECPICKRLLSSNERCKCGTETKTMKLTEISEFLHKRWDNFHDFRILDIIPDFEDIEKRYIVIMIVPPIE